jgi:hypothetical protein
VLDLSDFHNAVPLMTARNCQPSDKCFYLSIDDILGIDSGQKFTLISSIDILAG